MKKFLSILVFFCLILNSFASERSLKMMYYDYSMGDLSIHPLSIGITSWTDKRYNNTMSALYGSVAMLSYKDIVRLEVGGCATWDKNRVINNNNGSMTIAMITGISTLINEKYVVGIWMSPFWNLYGSRPSDPYGIMFGYAF